MKIKIVTVGKIKEKFFTDAIAEYAKRISRYATVEVIEVADEMTPDKCPEAETLRILTKEGERILNKIGEKDYVITLEIEGTNLSSEKLASKLDNIMLNGASTITFVIGGSLGLSREVKMRSNFPLSFSQMTFPHQLMRVVLLEQIYRSFRIINNEPYHK